MSSSITIQEQESSLIEIIPFAIRLPASIFQGLDEPSRMNPQLAAILYDTGVVGTLTVLRNSVMIWFGWGKFQQVGEESSSSNAHPPSMGPLMVGMPRTHYQGAFSDREASCTKLVGSDLEEDELLCRQMASRLSAKLRHVAVLCSCSLRHGAPAAQGVDPSLMQHRVAALTEKHVFEMLRDKKLSAEAK